MAADDDLAPKRVAVAGAAANGGNFDGVALLEGRLYLCPYNADFVVCIDPTGDVLGCYERPGESPAVVDPSTGYSGAGKWSGCAAACGKVFCAPHNAGVVLVIDAHDGDAVSSIDCGYAGNQKWSGICASRGKLYCAPFNAASVLCVDPAPVDALREAAEAIACVSCAGANEPAVALCDAPSEFFDAAAPPPRPKFHYETAWEEDRAAPAAAEEDAPEDYTDVPLVDAKLALRDAFDAYPPLKPLPPGLTADV
ncbi:hypothetical protein JL720_4498 [Aureococcus anophagefferens]|nr:hypothetical protein JL720_4498 [Aureococcus anophagefferens]